MIYWTEELFEKHPGLFLKMLEERVEFAKCEVDLLLECLSELGFKPRNILDLNCGIGRHSVELGKRGINVLGTDLSRLYIEIARKRARAEGVESRVRFEKADMRRIASTLSREKPFDGVVNLFTSFGFYDDETNTDILRQCSCLVRRGGFFALEIGNRDWLVRNFKERDFSRHEGLIVLEERELDAESSRMHSTWTFLVEKGERNFNLERQITIDHRVWSLHELIELFKKTGWDFVKAYPGFRRLPIDVPPSEAPGFLLIGKKSKSSK
jgi:SAM-dependent methyltransferase